VEAPENVGDAEIIQNVDSCGIASQWNVSFHSVRLSVRLFLDCTAYEGCRSFIFLFVSVCSRLKIGLSFHRLIALLQRIQDQYASIDIKYKEIVAFKGLLHLIEMK